MRSTLVALFSGTLFGAGLAIAQMTNPAKVIGFLDVAGAWDPSLAFVMAGALSVSAVAFHLHRRKVGPRPHAAIDARLLGGAALFGTGWGLAGLCPGPAVASLVSGSGQVALFVVSMIAGMGIFRLVAERTSRAQAPVTPQHAA
jgi:uncharacterized membrane protein YedE/YeeE